MRIPPSLIQAISASMRSLAKAGARATNSAIRPERPEELSIVGREALNQQVAHVGVAQDGIFGPQTERAVIQWQKNLKITPDGIWGPATEQATHDLFVFLNNLPAVAPSNPFFDALNDARTQVLRQGSNGGAVKIAQLALNGKGYRLVGDGIFGPATDSAVRRFQSSRGLQADGIVGPQTWNALLS